MTIKNFDVLDELGLNVPIEQENALVQVSEEQKPDKTKEMIQEDFETSRTKLASLLDTAQEAIENFKDIALETQEPRAYEVLATLIKNTGDLTKTLMDNAKTKVAIDKDSGVKPKEPESQQVTNSQTNIFVGTTKDLKAFLKAQQEPILEYTHNESSTDTTTK